MVARCLESLTRRAKPRRRLWCKGLSCVTDGFRMSKARLAARVITDGHRVSRNRFPPLRAYLILQSNTATVEFEANQALCNQESVNRRERIFFNSRHVLNSIEPACVVVKRGFACCVADRVTVQNRQAVLFKLAGLSRRLTHIMHIDNSALCVKQRSRCRSDPDVPNHLPNP